MKKIRFISLLGIAFLSCSLIGCTKPTINPGNNNIDGNNEPELIIEEIKTNDDAITYNDTLVADTESCFWAEENVWTAYYNVNTEDFKSAINSLLSTCDTAINDIKNIDWLDEDFSLRDGVIVVLEKYLSYYNKFSELAPYIGYDLENMTEEDAAAYKTITSELDAINTELIEANNSLTQIQETFAANHGYDLEMEEENIEEEISED